MVRLAEPTPPNEKEELSEIDWPKRGELRTPTGTPGLTWFKGLSTSTLKLRL
jgi:hypothetical protein